MKTRGYRFWDDKLKCYAPDDDFWITYKGEWATHKCSKYRSYRGEDIIPEQSTGLRDNNGREVWEGDIVSRNVPRARAGAIQFAQGIFGINWDYGQNPDPLWLEGSMFGSWNGKHNLRPIDDNFVTENMEVIGNIHEHPELLNA